jgi:hypothetical protein
VAVVLMLRADAVLVALALMVAFLASLGVVALLVGVVPVMIKRSVGTNVAGVGVCVCVRVHAYPLPSA